MPTAVGTGKRPRRNFEESYLLTGYSFTRLEELGPPPPNVADPVQPNFCRRAGVRYGPAKRHLNFWVMQMDQPIRQQYEGRNASWLEDLMQDVRFGLRSFSKD